MSPPFEFLEYLPLTLKEEKLEEFDGDDFNATLPSIDVLQLFKLCRVCAEPSNNMVSIYSDGGKLMQLAEKIQQHLPINVRRDDALPLQVCINCVLRLDAFHQMAKVCSEADKKLRCYFNETQSYSIESESPVISVQDDNENNEFVSDTYTINEAVDSADNSVTQDTDYTEEESQDSNEKSKKMTRKRNRNYLKRELICIVCQNKVHGTANLIKHCVTSHEKHMCRRCGRLFDNSEELFSHMQSTHMIKCWCCDDFFVTRDAELKSHFQDMHAGENPYRCEQCEKYFASRNLLLNHIKTHAHEKKFICHTCGLAFKIKHTLNQHMVCHLPSAERNTKLCSVCGKRFRTDCKLKYHMRTHTGELPFKCDLCPKSFHRLENFKLHKAVHTKERKYKCDQCDVSYIHLRNLDGHKKFTHIGSWEYQCKVCDTKFKSEQEVVSHLTTHSESEVSKFSRGEILFMKVSDFQCECGKYLRNKYLLTAHARQHKNSQKPYKPYVDSRRGSGIRIKRQLDDADKTFTCETCGKKLASKISLQIHLRTHMAVKPFACKLCSKSFICKIFLDDHIRTHTGEEPFVCTYCGKKFHRKNNCRKHERAVHLNIKPHTCVVCGKAFKNGSSLSMHNRIHTGEKRFICDICDRAFTQKPDMKRHRARHDFSEVCSSERRKVSKLNTRPSTSQVEAPQQVVKKTVKSRKSKTSNVPSTSNQQDFDFPPENLRILQTGESGEYVICAGNDSSSDHDEIRLFIL